jgi:ABC-type nitrate/sulfonate/bicarbonate transport system permease component
MNLLIALLVLCGVWEMLARLAAVSFFPPLSLCLLSCEASLFLRLMGHVAVSMGRVSVGLGIGGILGAIVGLYLGQHSKADRLAAPFLFLTYPFPKVVLIPLLLFAFGPGEMSKLALLAIFSFYQLAVTGRDAAKAVPASYLLSFRTLSGSPFSLYRHVVLPACVPQLLSGLRISLATCLALLFFTETYATEQGIGYAIWDAFSLFDYPRVYLASSLLCGCGWGLYAILAWLEAKLVAWR